MAKGPVLCCVLEPNKYLQSQHLPKTNDGCNFTKAGTSPHIPQGISVRAFSNLRVRQLLVRPIVALGPLQHTSGDVSQAEMATIHSAQNRAYSEASAVMIDKYEVETRLGVARDGSGMGGVVCILELLLATCIDPSRSQHRVLYAKRCTTNDKARALGCGGVPRAPTWCMLLG